MASLLDGGVRGGCRGWSPGCSLGGALLACALSGCGGDGGRAREESVVPSVQPASAATPPLESAGAAETNGELLLDDLTDGDARFTAGSINGEWFTYSDGTSTVTPPDHMGLLVSAGESHVVGQGFSDWGVGLSAYLRSADLSAFCGLKLTARGSGSLVLELATPATSPESEGGTCVGSGCFGHFATKLQLEPTYRDFELAFAELAQPSWAQPAQLSLAGVISFNLVAKVEGGAPASIDLWVDRLALEGCP
jgi:hypothetical protein